MTVILDLFWFLGTQDYCLRNNSSLTNEVLQEMRVEFQQHFEKNDQKTGYFQIIVSAVSHNVFQWNSAHLLSGHSLLSQMNPQGFLEYFGRYCNLKFAKWKNTKKLALFPCRGRENLRIYSWYFLANLKCEVLKVFHLYQFIQLSSF